MEAIECLLNLIVNKLYLNLSYINVQIIAGAYFVFLLFFPIL